MENGGFIVNSVPVYIGDARFTLYHMQNMSTFKGNNSVGFSHCHIFYEIRIAVSGSYNFSFPEKNIRLDAGEILIIPPGEYHHSLVQNTDFKEIVCSLLPEKCGGAPAVFSKYRELLLKHAGKPFKCTPELADAASLFLSLQKSIASSNADGRLFSKKSFNVMCQEQNLAISFVSALGNCMGMDELSVTEKSVAENIRTKKVDIKTALLIELMTGVDDLSLSEMAHQLNYSEKHTSRLIKEIYGTTFSEYQRTIKLSSIKKMLENPEMSIDTAARKAGYKSVATLYRDFRRYEGLTPLEYRKKVLKEKENNHNE